MSEQSCPRCGLTSPHTATFTAPGHKSEKHSWPPAAPEATGVRTAAGRALLEWWLNEDNIHDALEVLARILAIETEAALDVDVPPLTKREEFEALRYCRQCGRRLIYAQYDTATAQVLTKRCPEWVASEPIRHEFIEVEQPMPHRDKRGHLTRGSKARLATPQPVSGEGEA